MPRECTPNRANRGADLIKLRREWYGRLESDGFEDIEYLDAADAYSHLSLRNPASQLAARMNPTTWAASLEYWDLAATFTHEHVFRSPMERECFEHYAQGLSYREIGSILGRHFTTVAEHITRVLQGPFDRYLKQVCSMPRADAKDCEDS